MMECEINLNPTLFKGTFWVAFRDYFSGLMYFESNKLDWIEERVPVSIVIFWWWRIDD